MKRTDRLSKFVLIGLILGTLAFFACGGPKSDFEKTKKLNTIEAYNKFIEKYPDNPLATDAINLRDQLAFEMASDSASVDSLAPLKANALENLVANAEQAWRHAEKNDKDSQAAQEFTRAAKLYQHAARIQKIIGKDSTESYKRAAYAYYKAVKRLRAEQLLYLKLARALVERADDFSEAFNSLKAMELLIFPLKLQKSLLHGESVKLFRKAGMDRHADWMMEGDTTRVFDLPELEPAPDTTAAGQNAATK